MKHTESIRTRRLWLTLALACPVTFGGCQFSPSKSLWPNSLVSQEEPLALPDRVMPFWTDTVLYQPKQPGIRGFGGRVYFYKDSKEEPVEVDGNLIVYAFDNEAAPGEAGKPVKKFVFTADQFATHMSRTNIGASYSIWLPWDEVGGPTKQLSLVTRFEGRDGGVVISEPTVKLLPGVNAEIGKSNSAGTANDGTVQPASFISGQITTSVKPPPNLNSPTGNQNNDRPAMTLDLPPSFQRHLRNRHDSRVIKPSDDSNDGLTQTTSPDETQSLKHAPSASQFDTSASTRTENQQTNNSTTSGSKPLRDTFRKPATSSDGQVVPNGRPANWLVAPR